jgi:hypothetical protein
MMIHSPSQMKTPTAHRRHPGRQQNEENSMSRTKRVMIGPVRTLWGLFDADSGKEMGVPGNRPMATACRRTTPRRSAVGPRSGSTSQGQGGGRQVKAYLHPKAKPTSKAWYAYDVTVDGETVLTDSRDPEHESRLDHEHDEQAIARARTRYDVAFGGV